MNLYITVELTRALPTYGLSGDFRWTFLTKRRILRIPVGEGGVHFVERGKTRVTAL